VRSSKVNCPVWEGIVEKTFPQIKPPKRGRKSRERGGELKLPSASFARVGHTRGDSSLHCVMSCMGAGKMEKGGLRRGNLSSGFNSGRGEKRSGKAYAFKRNVQGG